MSFLLNLNAAQVLILAGDLELSDFLNDVLVDAGYSTQKAYTLDDARFMVNYTHFDLALVDSTVVTTDSELFYQAVSDDRLFGKLPWVCVTEVVLNDSSIKGAQELILLAESSYSPHVILRAIAQAIDANTPEHPPTTNTEAVSTEQMPDADAQKMFQRKLREHQILSSIARMLNSSLDLTTVLTKVVDAATSLTGAEEGLLLLPDEDGRRLYIRAAKGIDSDTAKEFRIKTEDTLAGQVFKTGQPVLIGDSGWQKVKTEYFVKSLLYVPMKFKDRVIGVLGVNNRTDERTFNTHDVNVLLDLASHAAIAIENARLYGESVQRSRELGILFAASQAVNTTLAVDEVLSIITEQMATALDIGWCDISLYQSQTHALHYTASHRQAQWHIKQISGSSKHQPPSMILAAQRGKRVYLSPSTARENKQDIQYLIDKNALMIGFFPLHLDQRLIGMFELTYCRRPTEHAHSLSSTVIQQLALQLMIAVDSTSITAPGAEKQAQQLLAETEASFAALHLWDETQDTFHKQWCYGKAVWAEEYPRGFALEEYSLLEKIVTDGTPVHLTRHQQDDPEIRNLLDRFEARTLLALPLTITGEVQGVVFLADTVRQRQYDQREIDLANALITQAASAINNAWLYRDLQNSMDELRLAQGQLIQAARLSAMGELAAAVAHQINNPLTTVIADTQMILADMDDDHIDYEPMMAVHRAGKRAHEVVSRLLGMAHQKDGDALLQSLDVNETISNTLELVSRHIQKQQVLIEVELEPDLPPVYGLVGQLEDVWMNLLLNARDAVTSSQYPQIGILSRLSSNNHTVVVEVWDNGIGIPQDKQDSIFTAFFTTKPQGEGTGLGLHICRQVVEKCGGEISLKHSDENGTRFEVRLPTV